MKPEAPPSPTRARVLAAARSLDAKGVYPSADAVSRAAGMDKNTAGKHLAASRKSGELRVKTPVRTGGNGGGCRPGDKHAPPPDIADRVEHYAARLGRGWDLFVCSPFRGGDE